MNAISVKELREKFPFVRSELKKGTSFLVIYKSKPIAELKPVNKDEIPEEATDGDFERAALTDLNKALGDDFLTKEEVAYYMSLPNKK